MIAERSLGVSIRYINLIAIITILLLTWVAKPANAQTKYVFAHYMVTNQDYQCDDPTDNPPEGLKIQAYEKEMLQAKADGFDGFALNCGGWYSQTYYITYATEMFEAAADLNDGFKLMFSCDFTGSTGVNDAEDMMRRFVNNSAYSGVYFNYNGSYVLSTFSGDTQIGVSGFSQIKSDLENGTNPLPAPSGFSASSSTPMSMITVLAPFWGGETPQSASAISGSFDQFENVVDGIFYWGIAGVPGSGGSIDNVNSSQVYASVVEPAGKIYMAPVCFQFWGADASRYFEYSGYSGYRKMWMSAINTTHPNFIENVTWNDFIEGTYVAAMDDPSKYPYANFLNGSGIQTWSSAAGPPLGYWHSHYAAGDLASYFIQWYKTGTQPTISSDEIFWAYRTQPMSVNVGTPNIGAINGPEADDIYVTCNLTAPATLTVTQGGTTDAVISVPAGSNDVSAPFVAGPAPTFTLTRNGSTVYSGSGTDTIQNPPVFTDNSTTAGGGNGGNNTQQLNDLYYSTGDSGPVKSSSQGPPAPANLTATAGSGQIALSWSSSSGATSYNVYRGTSSGGESGTPIASGLTGTSYTDTSVSNGTTYYYEVAAVDGGGTSGMSNQASATPSGTEAPYGGAPAAIPGTVQAENYDTGGQGLAYNVTSINGNGTAYRSDGVDIETTTDTGGGYDLGWTSTGQWFKYTVNVATAGAYTVTFRVAAGAAVGSSGGSFHIQNSSGTNLSGEVNVPGTGGWQTWTNVTANVTLPAGQQTLGYYQDVGGFNLNYMTFALNAPVEAPYGGAPAAIPGTVQAENYDTGGQGVAYNVTSTNGTANSYRSDGVDIETTTDTGGGYDVGWTSAGQWFNYTVNVATAGTYTVTFRVASGNAVGSSGGSLHLQNSSGTNLTGEVSVPGTGGWQTWTNVTASVTLPAGQQVLECYQDVGGYNLNYMTFASSGSADAPYGGTPAAVPGTVQAENYDTGGQGVAYNVTSINGSANSYRSDGVDLETTSDTGGGYDLGWTTGGQWFNYTVNVATAGTYTVTFRLAAPSAVTSGLHIAGSSGTNLSGEVSIPASGGWQTWENVTANVTLPAGRQILTVDQDAGGWNLNYMTFAVNGGGSTPPAPTGLTAVLGNAQVSLNWTGSSGATSYNVYRGTTSGGESSTPIATGLTGTSYTNTGLTNGTTYYYKVAAVNSAGTSGMSNEANSTPTAGLTAVDQIDCGSPSAVSPFAADEFFNSGNEFSSTATINTSGVTNAAPAAVYQTVRWNSSFNYTIPNLTAGSTYTVRLHFCELTWTAAGQRVFNVAINGNSYLSNFDIFATAGAENKAVVEQTTATANSSGQIVISFTQGSADNPEIAGIEILH